MITIAKLTKEFPGCVALKDFDATVADGKVHGLVGSNGAGKSTFLRLIAGVYRPTAGAIAYDGRPVWDNPAVKRDIAFIPDELHFFPGASVQRMAAYYRGLYPAFDDARLARLLEVFGLDPKGKIANFSKGMKRQAATALGLACRTRYLFFDETFDGLDPVKRNAVKEMLRADARERGSTVVIASHSLRELEDACDQLTLVHQGGVVLDSEVAKLRTNWFKVQVAFAAPCAEADFAGFAVKGFHAVGRVATFITTGDREDVRRRLEEKRPLLVDVLPLSLEEVCIYEMGALGYALDLD